MTSDKRDFTNFNDFPGSINSDTNQYEFPPLYHDDKNGKKRVWTLTARLIKGKQDKYAHGWNILTDNVLEIKNGYLTKKLPLPDNSYSQVWAQTGIEGGKISVHPPMHPKAVNVGRANERNELQQALVHGRAKYLKRREEGGRTLDEYKEGLSATSKLVDIETPWQKYFPMLVSKYDDEKKRVVFPAAVQRKLDGLRCVAQLENDEVIFYTRAKKDIPGFKYLKKEMPAEIFTHDGSPLYIDGELYKFGMPLQKISGIVRNVKQSDDTEKNKPLEYHIFDCFVPKKPNLEYSERAIILGEIFKKLDSPYLVPVLHEMVDDDKECDKLFNKYVAEGYEGAIVRNMKGPYLTHPTKSGATRSKFIFKRKPVYSAEYEVVGFSEGKKGRDVGAIIWELVVPINWRDNAPKNLMKKLNAKKIIKKKKLKGNEPLITFNATPKNTTYEIRYDLYKKASENDGEGFRKLYSGRMMTIQFEDLSVSGVPARAKAEWFRDHK
jgi:hypothetical protein